MNLKNSEWQPDDSQQKVIDVQSGYSLVLAPPGCGKTQILTERIRKAHELGVDYADMLCLTFTNRAARGMKERIGGSINDKDVENVFVGNVHRFCSKFLFEYGFVPAESSVIDDEDSISILARYLNEDEYAVANNYNRHREYAEIIHFSNIMYQIEHHHPKELRNHTECISKDDVFGMSKICDVQGMAFDAKAMVDIYSNTDTYREICRSDGYDYGSQRIISVMLRKMEIARQYEEYKRKNKLMDFSDLLMLTYESLRNDTDRRCKRYPWIQVDEVQDLNPLQMAIVDLLTEKSETPSVMYLGDEQQAIFSFMGAKVDTLDMLKKRCEKNVFHLNVNHRSPKYLLDVFNCYATNVLGIASELLPDTDYTPARTGNELQILRSSVFETEICEVAATVKQLYEENSEERTAVIVNANADADLLSEELKKIGVPHFKVSGEDLFSTAEMKLLFAHFTVLSNENNFIAWSRIMKGLHVFEGNAASRNFVRELLDRAMLPSDFLLYEDTTYVQHFINRYEKDEIVIFDTETTGLNVFEDDILQIAAIKVRNGKVVDGSEFSVFISTDRPIPLKLGDIDNPIIEEMKAHPLLDHATALQRFMDYVGGDVLLGHNANYDYNILDNNLRRYLPSVQLHEQCPEYFDSLKLVRLLEPDLKEYKLKYLLSVLNLEGENSHLADADVNATRSVVVHCYDKALGVVAEQCEFVERKSNIERIDALRRNYREFYMRSRELLYVREPETERPVLVSEMLYFYERLVADGTILPLDAIGYAVDYLSGDMIDAEEEPSLVEQLSNHIIEMNTLKEADLCNGTSIKDRTFVTTVHKAKGLEFDNVIVFDAVEGRCPNFYTQNNPRLVAEDARKFYVAMSRAQHRLYVSQSLERIDYRGQHHPHNITRFMNPILKFFN